jgi:hypothetical protein
LRKLAVTLFILFTVWVACFLVARRIFIKERDTGWELTGGSLMGFGARFPTEKTNEAAQDLEQTAALIGYPTAQRSSTTRKQLNPRQPATAIKLPTEYVVTASRAIIVSCPRRIFRGGASNPHRALYSAE